MSISIKEKKPIPFCDNEYQEWTKKIIELFLPLRMLIYFLMFTYLPYNKPWNWSVLQVCEILYSLVNINILRQQQGGWGSRI